MDPNHDQARIDDMPRRNRFIKLGDNHIKDKKIECPEKVCLTRCSTYRGLGKHYEICHPEENN